MLERISNYNIEEKFCVHCYTGHRRAGRPAGAYGEPSEKMLGVLKRLESNGKHLLGLINDVLDLSKIEAGQLVLELSDYSIQDIAQTVRSTLEPLAADKKLAFKVEVAPQLPSGRGNGRRLTQVLINLVGNAIPSSDVEGAGFALELSRPRKACMSGRRSAAKLLTKDEARRIAVNTTKLPELLRKT